jgi:hypothetical protein
MPPKIPAVLALLFLLCGCGLSSGPEAEALDDALNAYQSGDGAAVQATLARFDSKVRPVYVSDPCSEEAYAARRIKLYRGLLDSLARSGVPAMNEETRLVYFQAAAIKRLAKGDDFDAQKACKDRPEWADLANKYVIARAADAQALAFRWMAWRKDLGWRCGSEWEARLDKARGTLRFYCLPSSWDEG